MIHWKYIELLRSIYEAYNLQFYMICMLLNTFCFPQNRALLLLLELAVLVM
jgi:hypothetical protein